MVYCAEMVSYAVNGERSQSVHKRKRMDGAASPSVEALTPAQQRQAARHRKQKLMSKLSDSGFEEDLMSSPIPSPFRTDVPPLHPDQQKPGQLSCWYLQYGDIGFKIQREKEAQFHPCKSLVRQPQLTEEARCTLVSWLIQVHRHFRLSFECCCLAVNITDRFLASTPVAADCFQLLGVSALLLASKQVEMCSPQISHLLSLCCDAFTKEQLCNLECLILRRLNFRLDAPTLAFFLDYYTNCIEAAQLVPESTCGDRFQRPRRCSHLAQKVCELTLADYAFNKYPPSLTAGCALRIASKLLKTEQGLAAVQSQEDQWDSFVNDLCTKAAQPPDSPLAMKDHSFAEDQANLAAECKDNLRLLVSLNQEALAQIE
ncbi:cyclin-O [Parambassis ranga]|uniref:G2/mitotic-specific cyclin-B2 n=1 Tax=Parambassis ranga TaxID=210632 RepID=A0A6P7IZG8_9TELE|nr:cyclin-O [Parambassis ranga]